MLVVETIAKIRRAYFQDKEPIKQICRELRVSRKTVRKVVRSGATEFTYERSVQPQPKIGPWRDELERILAENERKPRRHRQTAIRIFEELKTLGYEGGYYAVRRYAAAWSNAESAASAAAFMPLSFDPGEAYQFDWSHEVAVIDGHTTTVKVAHVRLCHSRMVFVRAYPRESQEMVFDAHDKAFAFFGGACTRGIYDSETSFAIGSRTMVERRRPWTRSSWARTARTTAFAIGLEPMASRWLSPADVWALPRRTGRLHAGLRLGEGPGREPGRGDPPAALRAAASFQELCRAQRLARGPVRRLGEGAPASRVAGPDRLGGVRGGAAEPRALCRAVRRLPRRPGLGVEDLPRAVRQQPLLGRGPGRRPAGR